MHFNINNKHYKTNLCLMMVVVLCVFTIGYFVQPAFVCKIDNYLSDFLNKLDPFVPEDQGCDYKKYDEQSRAIFGAWPLSRDVLADIVTRLDDYGARAIIFDTVYNDFDRTSPHLLAETIGVPSTALRNNDLTLSQAMKDSRKTVTAFRFIDSDTDRQSPGL